MILKYLSKFIWTLQKMKLTKNFKSNEFNCKCKCKFPARFQNNRLKLAKNLQIIRDFIGKPLKINSSFRCKAHNKAVGGVSNSQHTTGKAADVKAKGMNAFQLGQVIRDLQLEGKIARGGVGQYASFVHYDIRGHIARWEGSK